MNDFKPNRYRAASAASIRDTPGVRDSVGSATRTFDANRTRAFSEIESERWRDWARDVKTHALTELDRRRPVAPFCGLLVSVGHVQDHSFL